MNNDTTTTPDTVAEQQHPTSDTNPAQQTPEHGGITGPEPTRYSDWEKNGRCIDF